MASRGTIDRILQVVHYQLVPGTQMDQPDDLIAIEQALEQLLRLNASRKVHTRRAAAAGVAISKPGLLLLRRLHQEGAMSIGDLARRTEMDPAATGRQIRLLEEDGLVTRTRGSEDGRVVAVQVTPKGAEVRRRIDRVGERHMEDVLAGWSPVDRRRFAMLLPRFVGGLRTVPYRSDVDGMAS